MLKKELDIDSLLELHPSNIAEFCDCYLDVASLVESLEAYNPFGRKGLCEYLGIGESTLSGWIKEGRVPQMAKNAFVLLEIQQRLSAEVQTLREEIDESRNDLKVIRSGQHYQVCEFKEDEEGEVVGRVVADRIATIEDARLLASGRRAIRLIKECEPAFRYVREMTENDVFLARVEEIERKCEAHELLITDYPGWKARFGKLSLDEFLVNGAQSLTTESASATGNEDDRHD